MAVARVEQLYPWPERQLVALGLTAIVAGALAAVFGGSRVQVSGPTGAMTVVLVPIVIGGIPFATGFGLFKWGQSLLRRPIDPDAVNGTVVVDWFNVTAGVDGDPDFGLLYPVLLGGGFTYVGVSAQQVAIGGGQSALDVLADHETGRGARRLGLQRLGRRPVGGGGRRGGGTLRRRNRRPGHPAGPGPIPRPAGHRPCGLSPRRARGCRAWCSGLVLGRVLVGRVGALAVDRAARGAEDHARAPGAGGFQYLERAAGFFPDDPASSRLEKLETLLDSSGAETGVARSLIAELLSLPPETVVHTGHGDDTTVGAERAAIG